MNIQKDMKAKLESAYPFTLKYSKITAWVSPKFQVVVQWDMRPLKEPHLGAVMPAGEKLGNSHFLEYPIYSTS